VRPGESRSDVRDVDGAALLVALLATMLMTALATALMLATMTEAMIAASYRDALVTFYAAEGAAELAIGSVRAAPDWRALASSSAQWTFPQPSGSAVVRATSASLASGVETLEFATQASGPRGVQRTLVVVIARDNPPISGQIRVVSWRENP
jgi:hypothetical protein